MSKSKYHKTLVYKIFIDIYKINISVVFNKNWKIFAHDMCNCNPHSSGDALIYFNNDVSPTEAFMFFHPKVSLSTIGHEVFHMIIYLCDHYGIVIDERSSEAGAYLFGYLFDEVLAIKKKAAKAKIARK